MNLHDPVVPGTIGRPKGDAYIILLSGGLDSSVLAYFLKSVGIKLKALTINYGQRHVKEQVAARAIAALLGFEHRTVALPELTPLFGDQCSLVTEQVEIPEGHYAHESMKSTVVPNRNMIFLSLAVAWSVASAYDGVAYAAHAGDHTIYPDCRPAFADAMAHAISLCDVAPQELLRPFIASTKGDIARLGSSLGVPFQATWSCYNGRALHCGACGTCTERIEAFQIAGIADPTQYETKVPIPG
jgi:7-cyano-7-deazaguanine synthase